MVKYNLKHFHSIYDKSSQFRDCRSIHKRTEVNFDKIKFITEDLKLKDMNITTIDNQ